MASILSLRNRHVARLCVDQDRADRARQHAVVRVVLGKYTRRGLAEREHGPGIGLAHHLMYLAGVGFGQVGPPLVPASTGTPTASAPGQ